MINLVFCRGVLIIELLRKLEELTGRRVCEMFDYICGVSTGAILACLFGPHKKNLHDCAAMYKEISIQIFNQNSFVGTSNMLWSHSYYNTPLWEQILQQNVGTIKLIKTARDLECPKVCMHFSYANILAFSFIFHLHFIYVYWHYFFCFVVNTNTVI